MVFYVIDVGFQRSQAAKINSAIDCLQDVMASLNNVKRVVNATSSHTISSPIDTYISDIQRKIDSEMIILKSIASQIVSHASSIHADEVEAARKAAEMEEKRKKEGKS